MAKTKNKATKNKSVEGRPESGSVRVDLDRRTVVAPLTHTRSFVRSFVRQVVDGIPSGYGGPRMSLEQRHRLQAETAAKLELQRTRVVCGPDGNLYTSSGFDTVVGPSSSAAHQTIDEFADSFLSNLEIEIRSREEMTMEFIVTGISCSLANALRRAMIAEVPTMAIEHVFIKNNTSIIQDEVLAHRLGMIPLRIDPRKFEMKKKGDPTTEKNTVILKMDVRCDDSHPKDATLSVVSDALTWLPGGTELEPEVFKAEWGADQRDMVKEPVRAVHDDILVAKLRSKQEISLECHCVKGTGEDHAKWSPVATAWYKLYPEVVLLKEVTREQGAALAGELPGLVEVDGKGRVVVRDALEYPKLLEKVRRMSGEEPWSQVLQLRKRKDRFVFTIESTGAYSPWEIWEEAVARLASKCDKVLEGLARGEE